MRDVLSVLNDLSTDRVFLGVGFATAGAQIAFRLLFASKLLPDGPWKEEPGFTAHQVVCFPMMILLTVLGWGVWFYPDATFEHPDARCLVTHAAGLMMAKAVFAMQVFWDIPTGLMVPSLNEAIMLAHHIGMATMAFFNLLGLWQYYAVFFYGVIEISGIFLSFVDIFHPKHKPWCDWLASRPKLSAFNDAMRAIFFLLYMCIRACYFPWVIVGQVCSDFLAMTSMPLEERQGLSIGVLAFCPLVGVAFAGLQLYWARLLTKQVLKMLGGGTPTGLHDKKR